MTTTTCARCHASICQNQAGGWMTSSHLGHYAILCPDGIHVHQPAQPTVGAADWLAELERQARA